jgi:hypothetical protein
MLNKASCSLCYTGLSLISVFGISAGFDLDDIVLRFRDFFFLRNMRQIAILTSSIIFADIISKLIMYSGIP